MWITNIIGDKWKLNCFCHFSLSNQQKAEYKAAEAATATSAAGGNSATDASVDHSEGKYGAVKLVQSQDRHENRVFVDVAKLPEYHASNPGATAWLRGRVHTSRAKGKQCFLILRQQSSTVQCVIAVNDTVSKQMVKFTGRYGTIYQLTWFILLSICLQIGKQNIGVKCLISLIRIYSADYAYFFLFFLHCAISW